MKKYSELKIGEETYRLAFPMRSVFGAEKELQGHNLLTLLQQVTIGKVPPCLSDMYVLFKYAVAGGNPEITEKEVEELYSEATEQYSIPEVFRFIVLAIRKSGVLGGNPVTPKVTVPEPGSLNKSE